MAEAPGECRQRPAQRPGRAPAACAAPASPGQRLPLSGDRAYPALLTRGGRMSAYMVDRNHIRYLVEAARCRRLHGDGTLYWFHQGVAYLLDSSRGTDCVNRPSAAIGQ